jgi:hypothetical protein
MTTENTTATVTPVVVTATKATKAAPVPTPVTKKIYWLGKAIITHKGTLFTGEVAEGTDSVLVENKYDDVPVIDGIKWTECEDPRKTGEYKKAPKVAKEKAEKPVKTAAGKRAPTAVTPGYIFADSEHPGVAWAGTESHKDGFVKLLGLDANDTRVTTVQKTPEVQLRRAPDAWSRMGKGEIPATNKGYLPADLYPTA